MVDKYKNPNWTRDEIIVSLHFYFENYPHIPAKNDRSIELLSNQLNQIGNTIFGNGKKNKTFRNVNGVYLKLMNFHHLNPLYSGSGMKNVSKLDQEVWQEFSNDRDTLYTIVEQILRVADSEYRLPVEAYDDSLVEAREGRILTRMHQLRERDAKLISSKKAQVQKKLGELTCEVCGFNFELNYGLRGFGFIECHHTKPVCEIVVGEKTKLEDLALLCSNCHRMIHRKKPWLSVEELRSLRMNQ